MVRAPQVASLSLASIVARLPFGMATISLVIFIHARTGSFGIAGLVTGFYTLSFALTGPWLGRLVDRRGPRVVLAPLAVVCALGLIAVVAIGETSAATVPLVLATIVAGAAVPPVSGVLRRTWSELVPRPDLHTAFLFDAVLIEIVFVCGPLLAGLLAAVVDPAAPLLVSAGLVLVGTAWFLLVPVVRDERPIDHEDGHPAGALTSATVRYVVLSGLPIGASIGALDVVMPAFGAAHGSSALGGLFAASLAFGSMLGAVAFGAVGRWFGDLRQASLRLGVYQPLVIAPLLLAPSPAVLLPLAILGGSFVAPMVTLRARIAELTMPPGTGTETFTWLLLSVMVGVSASSAVAGPLVQNGGWRLGVVLAIALPLIALPALFAGRRLLPTAQFQHE
ncbi:MAG: MFS transporter [Actinobacteria bacterium]|nr:MFS transporter [Actinomycetota bacterium]